MTEAGAKWRIHSAWLRREAIRVETVNRNDLVCYYSANQAGYVASRPESVLSLIAHFARVPFVTAVVSVAY